MVRTRTAEYRRACSRLYRSWFVQVNELCFSLDSGVRIGHVIRSPSVNARPTNRYGLIIFLKTFFMVYKICTLKKYVFILFLVWVWFQDFSHIVFQLDSNFCTALVQHSHHFFVGEGHGGAKIAAVCRALRWQECFNLLSKMMNWLTSNHVQNVSRNWQNHCRVLGFHFLNLWLSVIYWILWNYVSNLGENRQMFSAKFWSLFMLAEFR